MMRVDGIKIAVELDFSDPDVVEGLRALIREEMDFEALWRAGYDDPAHPDHERFKQSIASDRQRKNEAFNARR